jgi:hypothetical protein
MNPWAIVRNGVMLAMISLLVVENGYFIARDLHAHLFCAALLIYAMVMLGALLYVVWAEPIRTNN